MCFVSQRHFMKRLRLKSDHMFMSWWEEGGAAAVRLRCLGSFHSLVCGTVDTRKNENDRHHHLFSPPCGWKVGWGLCRPQHISEASALQHSPEQPKKLEELILLLCSCRRPPSAAAPRELNPLLLKTIWLHNLLQSHVRQRPASDCLNCPTATWK